MKGKKGEGYATIILLCVFVGVPLFLLDKFGDVLAKVAIAVAVVAVVVAVVKAVTSKTGAGAVAVALDMSQVDTMSGVQFESFVAALIVKHGYTSVTMTKASGDYGVDIVARKGGIVYAFQCKCYSSNLGVKSVQEVYSGAGMYNAQKSVVVTNAYFTKSAITLAKQLSVELWDRNVLVRLMGQEPRMTEQAKTSQVPEQNLKPVNEARKRIQTTQEAKRKDVSFDMAVRLGAGNYVFGENIPLGIYNLKVISGEGTLTMQKLKGTEWGEDWFDFGKDEGYIKSYHGLSLPEGKWFKVEGDVIFEISKAKMLEID